MGRTTNKQRRADSQQTARERAAAMRLEQQRSERRRRLLTIGIATVAVLAVVGVIVGIAASGGKNAGNVGSTKTIATQLASVSDASLNSAGTSGLNPQYATAGVPSKVTGPPLTSGGKPELLYIGAEFCPYCAGERWAMAIALDKFGTLKGFDLSHSGTTDGDLSTLTFRNATYSSPDLAFTPVEAQDRNHKTIANPTSAQTALWEKYTGNPPGYPFLDFGGKYVATDPTYDPFAVLGKLTAAQIAKDIKTDPTGDVAKPILTNANYITAAICGMTNNKPSACTASIQAIEKKLPTRPTSSTSSGSTASPAAS